MNQLAASYFSADRILKNTARKGPVPSDRDLLRRTLTIAWPAMLETFMVALVSVVDTIMVGTMGPAAIAAIGLSTQPKFLCLTVFISMNVAVSALVARRKGEGNREAARKVLTQALMLSMILNLVITLVALGFAEPMLHLMGTNADTHQMALEYLQVLIGGQVFNIINMCISAAQRGVGNTRIAMHTNVASNLVNVIFNYLLIGGHFGFPALGTRGAALATVLGTVVGSAMALWSVIRPESYLYIFDSVKRWRFDRQTSGSLLRIGSSTLAEQLFLRLGFMTYAMVVAKLGTTMFAAHQIGMNVLTISFALGDGLSMAAVALVGQSLGQKRPDLAKVYGGFCQRVGLIGSGILAVFFLVFGRGIFGLFTEDGEILQRSGMLISFIMLIVFFQVAQVVFSGCLRGGGDTRYVAMVSLISVTFIRPFFGWLFVYPLHLALFGAWLGLTMDQLMRLILTLIRFKSDKWLTIKI